MNSLNLDDSLKPNSLNPADTVMLKCIDIGGRWNLQMNWKLGLFGNRTKKSRSNR